MATHIRYQKYFKSPPTSFWLNYPERPHFSPLEQDLKVDIAIVGGGIAGIISAYLLTQKGLKVAVMDAHHILENTTGHTTAKITSQHGLIYDKIKKGIGKELAHQYAIANETAVHTFKKIIADNNISCDYMPESAYVYTLQDKYIDKLQTEADTASSFGISASFIHETPLPFKIKAALRFDNQAQFHPLKFLIALTNQIIQSGGLIFEQTRITALEEGSPYVLISDSGKKIYAEKVIIASHYPFYNKPGFYFSRIYQDRSYVVAIKAKEKYPGGMYINAETPTRSLRNQPTDDGELILISGDHHKDGQGPDTPQHYEALIDFAHQNFTVEDIPYRWSTQDCSTLDMLPYTGQLTSDTPNLYVTTGYRKWGMTNSMASALLLYDLILKGQSPWQDVYSPSRQTLKASAKNFVVQNLDVTTELLKGKFAPHPKDTDLKCGEAKIIKKEGERIGAYRDDEGTLHLVNTTCPHMGCELNWNAAEKTWDCPCHGSRFSYTGKVIEGPSVHSLSTDYDPNPIQKVLTEDF